MKRILFTLLCLVFGAQVHAAVPKILGGPTPGLWWNANESGRGYQVDLQGSIMIVTTYAYGPTGAVVWYVSAGIYNHATGTFESTFDNGDNGQCFGCAYRAPTPRAAAGGQMRIVFNDATTGTLYFNGGSTPIKRDLFGYPAKLDFLYGEFVLSSNTNGITVADWPILYTPFTNAGTQYVAGNQDLSSDVAIGTYVASSGTWLILIEAGAYDHYYEILRMDDRRLLGRAWIVPAGGDPTGNGVPAVGTRILMKDEVLQFVNNVTATRGPGAARVAAGSGTDAAVYAAQRESAQGEAPEHLVRFAREAKGLARER